MIQGLNFNTKCWCQWLIYILLVTFSWSNLLVSIVNAKVWTPRLPYYPISIRIRALFAISNNHCIMSKFLLHKMMFLPVIHLSHIIIVKTYKFQAFILVIYFNNICVSIFFHQSWITTHSSESAILKALRSKWSFTTFTSSLAFSTEAIWNNHRNS